MEPGGIEPQRRRCITFLVARTSGPTSSHYTHSVVESIGRTQFFAVIPAATCYTASSPMETVMDKAVENALARRAELRRELDEIEGFLSLYDRFKSLGSPQASLGIITPASAPVTGPARSFASIERINDDFTGVKEEQSPPSAPQSVGKGLSREELRPHIEALIREAGRPLTRGNLLRKLDQRGTPVGGKADRAKNMGTIMWRLKDHFVNLPGYGYWLKEVPYPALQYDPESRDDDHPETLGDSE